MHRVLDAHAGELRRCAAQQSRGGGIGVLDQAAAVHEDGVGCQFDQRAVARLGVAQRLLGALRRIDVDGDARNARRAAVSLALDDAADRAQPAPLARPGGKTVLGLVRRHLALQRPGEGAAHRVAVLRTDERHQVRTPDDLVFGRAAEQLGPARAHEQPVARHVEIPQHEAGAVDRQVEALARIVRGGLRDALHGDVSPHAAVAEEAAVGAQARLAGDPVNDARAVGCSARKLDFEERQPRGKLLAQIFERGGVDRHRPDLPEPVADRARFAEQRGQRRAARQPADAVLGIGFPEPVGGQRRQTAEALAVGAQLLDFLRVARTQRTRQHVDQAADEQRQRHRLHCGVRLGVEPRLRIQVGRAEQRAAGGKVDDDAARRRVAHQSGEKFADPAHTRFSAPRPRRAPAAPP